MKGKIEKIHIPEEAFIKGLRKGSREAEIEKGGRLKSVPYKNKKNYSRKNKHKGQDY
jgi:hypothetical protein